MFIVSNYLLFQWLLEAIFEGFKRVVVPVGREAFFDGLDWLTEGGAFGSCENHGRSFSGNAGGWIDAGAL